MLFFLPKRGGAVNSVKGARGDYQLARMPRQMTVFDVISAVEPSLFEKAESAMHGEALEIEQVMQMSVSDVTSIILINLFME